jgi:hypothetical protein
VSFLGFCDGSSAKIDATYTGYYEVQEVIQLVEDCLAFLLIPCSCLMGLVLNTHQPICLAINQFVYRDKCLKKSLIPFLRKFHSHDRYVFWPDLASAHYARTVQDYLKSQRVPFVQRKLNPANVPKCRPIENYWGSLKRKVYENDWSAKEIPQLIKRIKWAWTQVDSEISTRTCASVHRRFNTVARKGVDAL